MASAPRFDGEVRLSYLERDADADMYQGHNYTRVYVEEVGNFPSPAPVMKLMATLRSGAGVPVGLRATGNPGGPGHQWVKARYIDPVPLGNRIIRDPLTGLERVFIPSKVDNNQYIDVEAYKQRLRARSARPEHARLAQHPGRGRQGRCRLQVGHDAPNPRRVFISGQKRGVFGRIKRELTRRSAIEAVIGHIKAEGHLGRCYLKGRAGDADNVILSAVGYNLRLVLAWLRIILRVILLALLQTFIIRPALKPAF